MDLEDIQRVSKPGESPYILEGLGNYLKVEVNYESHCFQTDVTGGSYSIIFSADQSITSQSFRCETTSGSEALRGLLARKVRTFSTQISHTNSKNSYSLLPGSLSW